MVRKNTAMGIVGDFYKIYHSEIDAILDQFVFVEFVGEGYSEFLTRQILIKKDKKLTQKELAFIKTLITFSNFLISLEHFHVVNIDSPQYERMLHAGYQIFLLDQKLE